MKSTNSMKKMKKNQATTPATTEDIQIDVASTSTTSALPSTPSTTLFSATFRSSLVATATRMQELEAENVRLRAANKKLSEQSAERKILSQRHPRDSHDAEVEDRCSRIPEKVKIQKQRHMISDASSRVPLRATDREYLLAANRFYQSLGNMPAYHSLKFIVTEVERIDNKRLADQFAASNTYFTEQGYHSKRPVRRVYHGTHPRNIDTIVHSNLSTALAGKLDKGWFGKGLYFSRHADYCMMYHTTGDFRRVEAGDRGKLLQIDILPGRMRRMANIEVGAPRTPGFDSHVSPSDFEYVLFDSRHVLPRYVISFDVIKAAGGSFEGGAEELGELPTSDEEKEDDKDEEDEEYDEITHAQPVDIPIESVSPTGATVNWKIPLLSLRAKCKTNAIRFSPEFKIAGFKFRLRVHPNGDDEHGRKRVGIFVECRADDPPQDFEFLYSIEVVKPDSTTPNDYEPLEIRKKMLAYDAPCFMTEHSRKCVAMKLFRYTGHYAGSSKFFRTDKRIKVYTDESDGNISIRLCMKRITDMKS